MRKARCTEGQIASAGRRTEAGVPVEDARRDLRPGEAASCRRREQFAGTGAAEAPGEENQRLRRSAADLCLVDEKAPQDGLRKALNPGRRRATADRARVVYRVRGRPRSGGQTS
jgi:hypothetical protein